MSRALQVGLMVMLLSCVGCDQAIKILAKSHLSSSLPLEFLNGAVRVQYAENTGAFLSLGADLPEKARFLLFVGLVGPILITGLAFAFKSHRMTLTQKMGLILAVGGGIGNLIDRITHGAVVDFVSLGIGPLRTGIFNLADVAITVGLLLFLAAGARETGTIPAEGTDAA
ncbi:MAG TPA: signal peptidase II [Thermoanaerobaculia bacterium]|nr:signal peptidase II [Thermoanaerobaculia bacterium]